MKKRTKNRLYKALALAGSTVSAFALAIVGGVKAHATNYKINSANNFFIGIYSQDDELKVSSEDTEGVLQWVADTNDYVVVYISPSWTTSTNAPTYAYYMWTYSNRSIRTTSSDNLVNTSLTYWHASTITSITANGVSADTYTWGNAVIGHNKLSLTTNGEDEYGWIGTFNNMPYTYGIFAYQFEFTETTYSSSYLTSTTLQNKGIMNDYVSAVYNEHDPNSTQEWYYNEGYSKGLAEGKALGEASSQTAKYNQGYQAGYAVGLEVGSEEDGSLDVAGLADTILTAPIDWFSTMFDVEIFGFHIGDTFFAIIGLALVIWLIKKLI